MKKKKICLIFILVLTLCTMNFVFAENNATHNENCDCCECEHNENDVEILLQRCPKCGDAYINRYNLYGPWIQCGYYECSYPDCFVTVYKREVTRVSECFLCGYYNEYKYMQYEHRHSIDHK